MSDPIDEDKGGGEDNGIIKKDLALETSSQIIETTPNREVPTSPTGESIASDIQSLKSPDFDERELEDVQLNDRSEADEGADQEVYSSLPRYTFSPSDVTQTNDIDDITPSSTTQPDLRDNEKHNGEKVEETLTSLQSIEESTSTNDTLPAQLDRTTILHSSDESPEDTFKRLKDGLEDSSLSHKDIIDGLFNLLVGGPFDLESRFIIEHSTNIEKMLDLIEIAPLSMQAEIWSLFVGIVRKSFRNLEACSRVGLISICLDKLPEADPIISDLLIQLLSVLTSYSITVKETKHFLRALRASNNTWHRNSAKLLNVMQEMPKRDGADVFFSFPGKAAAGISLPPIAKWPYQNGWTFSTWLRMDPLNSVNFEKERPYLFSFLTTKGIGYQCYFMGKGRIF
jgi:hypothetical protein